MVKGVSVNPFVEISLHRQWIDFDEETGTRRGVKTPDEDALNELINADSPSRLREFTAQWFPFMSWRKSWEHPDFEDELKAVSDTRELILLVLTLKRLVDDDACSKENFENLGIRFGRGGTENHESADLNFLVSSNTLSRVIRGTNHCEAAEKSLYAEFKDHGLSDNDLIKMGYLDSDGSFFCPHVALSFAPAHQIQKQKLYLFSQREMASSLDPSKRYPVMSFFGGNLRKEISYGPQRALFFIDMIIRPCIQGLRIQTRDGILAPQADTNFTSFWLCLTETFRDSRVTRCKACGLPIIVTKERGSKRQYCNDTCKRKYKRALRFAHLVNEEHMNLKEASAAAGIAVTTAERMLSRNEITINAHPAP